ncbi:MAG: hypothetical protein ACE1ZG_08050 [Gammaproteobacteria bacterium]
MTRRQRIRRTALLCIHCLRNIAFYKASWRNGVPIYDSEFWAIVNNNSLDICILEWCKLFVDSRGKHYWRKVITEPITFFDGLMITLHMTEEEFNSYIEEVKSYRDMFIAHLDSEEVMHVPHLDAAKQSASYLYDYLRNIEDNGNYINEAPDNAETRFNRWTEMGEAIYEE